MGTADDFGHHRLGCGLRTRWSGFPRSQSVYDRHRHEFVVHTLDTTTGVAALVGVLTGPGVTETNPKGIASRTGVFAIDATTGEITYTGHPPTAVTEYTLKAHVGDHRGSTGDTDHTVDVHRVCDGDGGQSGTGVR